MKKMQPIIIALLVIVIIILSYCNYNRKCSDCSGNTSFCKGAQCNGYTGSGLEGMIPYHIAVEMSQRYAKDTGKKFVNQGSVITQQQDARSIWFDLEKIKRFIGFIENFACKQNCAADMRFGVRMYYAKYPGDEETLQRIGVSKEYANMHTLFMIPTYWDPERKMNIDFDPKGNIANCRPGRIDSVKGVAYGFAINLLDDGSDGENHGGLRPPPDGTGTFPQN